MMPNKKYEAHNCLLPFYNANQLKKDSGFSLCFSYFLKKYDNIDFLIQKVHELVSYQAHLRKTFALKNNKLITYIHEALPAQINCISCTNNEAVAMTKTLCNQRHDLENESSIKLNIIKITDSHNDYIILFNIHHILMDGYSLDEFIDNLNHLLQNNLINQIDSDNYFAQLKKEQYLKLPDKCDDIAHYVQNVEKIQENIHYKNDFTSEITNSTQFLPNEIYKKLESKSLESNESIFNLLLVAWSIFVAKINNQKFSIVSYPVDIRRQKNIQGCFVNTITLPFEFVENDSFSSILMGWALKKNWVKTLKQFQFNFNLDLSSNFAYSNFAKPNDLILQNSRIPATSFPQIAGALLSVKYREHMNSLFFSIDMPSSYLPMHNGSKLLLRYFNFISKILDNPNELIAKVDLTFDEEKKLLLNRVNNPAKNNDLENKTLTDLFESQVKKTPNRIAIVFDGIHLTYKQLNEKANQLASYLTKSYRIKPDDLVALLLDRNEKIIICILAILKSGGAYVPIDIDYPLERIEYILGDTQAKIVILNEKIKNKLDKFLGKDLNRKIIVVDNQSTQERLQKETKKNIINACSSSNLIYVIYTSGTTGNPKGVMIEHRSVVNVINYLIHNVYKKRRGHSEPLKITAFTSYAFDVSVSEFFVPLISGNELHILCNEQRKDIKLTSEYINNEKINYVYLPPVLLANFPKIRYPSLIGIIYAGEPCDKETASYWSKSTNLYNYYGPTETTIYATGLKIETNEVELIGNPIENLTAYVLDIYNELQPPGVTGELYIGGLGLARGYLNRKELTKEKFIFNKFQLEQEKTTGANTHIYKTGDLVRWSTNHHLEYIGRNDTQVKIRGHRIELKEIEATVLKYPGIKNVFVTIKEGFSKIESTVADKHLVCYYNSEVSIQKLLLEEYISLRLPDFMVPDIFIHLTHFPVTPNGKLDKKALPIPVFEKSDDYLPPSNEKEKIICDAFESILSLKKISINDNFFKIGGNSIKAISLAAELQNNFDANISDIYNLKTPQKIAENTAFIRNNLKNNLIKIKERYKNIDLNLNKYEKNSFIERYLSELKNIKIETDRLPINNVLLTGATGFLGCNLLNTLLSSTHHNVYLIIRSDSKGNAFKRIQNKFKYYFDLSLKPFLNIKLFIFKGDLEQNKLGLSAKNYLFLSTKVDSIIHSAALTRHYGDYETFYSANVQATINLLELSKLTYLKNFHYISTVSVLNRETFTDDGNFIFTEDDIGDKLNEHTNVYIKTKYEAENIVLKYRDHGINGNIYRVGNLAFILKNQRGQKNIEENAFFFRIRSLIHLGLICPEIAMEEISPVDLTAEAIIRLFDRKISRNQIFHVFDPKLYNIHKILCDNNKFKVDNTTVDIFFENIINKFNNTALRKEIERYLLHMGWLTDLPEKRGRINVLQNKTEYILKIMGFIWPKIQDEEISNYISKELEHGKEA